MRWLWYAWGGRLPDEYHQWVLYDLTCRTWVLRHAARALVQHGVWLLVLLLPIPWTLRWWMAALGATMGMIFAMVFIEDASERRMIQHGYPAGLNRRIREESRHTDRSELASLYASWYDRTRRGEG